MVKLHQPDGSEIAVTDEQGVVVLREISDHGIYEKQMPAQTAVILGRALIDSGRRVERSEPIAFLPAFLAVMAGTLLLCAMLWGAA